MSFIYKLQVQGILLTKYFKSLSVHLVENGNGQVIISNHGKLCQYTALALVVRGGVFISLGGCCDVHIVVG